jgi:transposase InsO family protein
VATKNVAHRRDRHAYAHLGALADDADITDNRRFPDLLKRDFSAAAPNVKWCGDMTEIPTDEGKLYLSTAIGVGGSVI